MHFFRVGVARAQVVGGLHQELVTEVVVVMVLVVVVVQVYRATSAFL